MRKELIVPEGVDVQIELPFIIIRSTLGELKKRFEYSGISIKYNSNEKKIKLECSSAKRTDLAVLGTITALIKNMIQGVQKEFVFKMECVFAHFPMSVKVQGNEIQIQNFLGERKARKINMSDGVTMKVNGNEIVIRGMSKEFVSQTAGKLEKACYKGRRDPRKFQDGIYPVGWSDE